MKKYKLLFVILPALLLATVVLAAGADLNNDNEVDVTDLGILLSSWGSTSKPPVDINQDGNVDVIDLGILLSNWGPVVPVCGDGVCGLIEDIFNCLLDCENQEWGVNTGATLKADRLNQLTQPQIDFINKNLDWLTPWAPELPEIKDAFPDVDVSMYKLINAVRNDSSAFDWNHVLDYQENTLFHSDESPYENQLIETPFGAWLANGYDFVDPESPDAQNHWINYYYTKTAADLAATGYDSVFVDSFTHTLFSWWTQGLTIREPYDDASYTQARRETAQYLKSLLPDKNVIINGLHQGEIFLPTLEFVDGAMHELFVYLKEDNDWRNIHRNLGFWNGSISTINEYKDKKILRLVAKKSDMVTNETARVIALASYLLVKSPTVSFSFGTGIVDDPYFDIDKLYFQPEFVIRPGQPIGDYYETADNLYVRNFENAIVVVNPHVGQDKTYNINMDMHSVIPHDIAYMNQDGTIEGGWVEYVPVSAGEIFLPAVSAVVLLGES